MVGPMDGAKVAVMANSAMPFGRTSRGSLVSTSEKAKGISAPPASPCNTRKTIMLCRLQAIEQSSEATTKITEMLTAKRRGDSTIASQAASGMMTISATRYEVEIHEPSSMVADSAPWMSLSDELMIWISRIAMKAPRMALRMAIQSRRVGGGICCVWAVSVTQINPDADRHARTYCLAQCMVLVEADLYRNALHHLGKVAGGVVRRQQAELRARGGEQAIDGALHRLVIERIEGQGDALVLAHALDLGFLEVGLHPQILARHQGQQMITGLHVLADAHGALADSSRHR